MARDPLPAAPVVSPIRPAHPAYPHVPVTGALRAVESFLLRGGQQTARQNAWAAVVADRQRARDRREAEYEMAALTLTRTQLGGRARD